MLPNQKIVLVENNFRQYTLLKNIFSGNNNVIWPNTDSAEENQSFITDVLSFTLTGGNEKIGLDIKARIENNLQGIPDYFILDLGLMSNVANDYSGQIFKDLFIDKHYPNAITIKISQHVFKYIDSRDKDKSISIPKYANGTNIRQIEQIIRTSLEKIK